MPIQKAIALNEPELPSQRTICVLVKAWPRVSTTFVAQELVGLEEQGLHLWLASLSPGEPHRHSLHDRLQAPVHYLPEPWRSPLRVLRAWKQLRGTAGYRRALSMFLEDQKQETLKRRAVRRVHFWQSLALVAEMPRHIGLFYAHFILGAGSIGRYASAITGLPFAASAHAKDIWTTPDWDKRDKLAAMRWCATCTTPGAEKLRQLTDDPDKVKLIYHGLSFSLFPPDQPVRPPRDGSRKADPVRLLSVGRAVEKKGLDVLLNALASLPPDLSWHLDHVGGGPLLAKLQAHARSLGLEDRIEWHGVETRAVVVERYRSCDLFVLPSREGSDGDRDGLPNVLMEAQSQGLACLSTRFSAIPELIEDGVTGILVPPADVEALTTALERLIRQADLREALGEAGFHRVRSAFQAEAGIAEIAALLRGTMAEQANSPQPGIS
ncbi:MAG TPA: glycosyltransferase family 4 protein [Allosphingosinicella sp.]|uniref:glycosyltransferase family 4 protein n=1 Tax=Allosphingosinicella sp. TaxID=2823234 RepID=UPI002EDBA09E